MTDRIAILRNPRLSVDDRGLVALRFDAALEGVRALQMVYLESDKGVVSEDGSEKFVKLIRAAGSFDKLDGLPIIVERGQGSMFFVRPADV